MSNTLHYWSLVRQDFDEKLPRRTAVVIKHDDWDLPFGYPADFGRIGWLLDSRKATSYKENPVLALSFAEYSYTEEAWANLEKNVFHFREMMYHPSVVNRQVVFANMGLRVDETFCQAAEGGFTWDLECACLSHPNHPFRRKLFTIVTVTDPGCRVSVSDGMVEIEHEGDATRTMAAYEFVSGKTEAPRSRVFIASGFEKVAVYTSTDNFLTDAASGSLGDGDGMGRYVVFQHDLAFSRGEIRRIRFGISFRDGEHARQALGEPPVEDIRKKWNEWFASLPPMNTDDKDELRAYYRCWMVARLDYYEHERWGRTMIEALPVYRGYWQWALNAHGLAAELNPELGTDFIRRLLNLFLEYQREDGFVTHAIYLKEEVPGETWSRENLVQTPHIPWVAMRYFNKTGDMESLRGWYPALRRYYDYLCESRDRNFMDLHLWAILASYDTGLDTTSAFEKVTYGEGGVRERFCYPAIFAAERARYEQAMAKMASALENGEESFWRKEEESTVRAMNERLWDDRKKWYGVIHEDGSLDTRVGVDGLFPLAYRLVDPDRAAEMRESFTKLIAPYGVRTVAPDEDGAYPDIYWRGPAWPKSISMGAAAALSYFPDLVDAVREGAVRFALAHPSIWECMNADTGEIGQGDGGMMATPVVSSNVGSVELLGALLMMQGVDVLKF